MKLLTPLFIAIFLTFGCAKKQNCTVKIEIKEAYARESGSKLSFARVVDGIHNLNLKEDGYGVTCWGYFSKDNSMSDLKCNTGGWWQVFPRTDGVLNNYLSNETSSSWEGMIDTNDYKYFTVLFKIHKNGSDEVIIQNWQQFKIDWK